jgi:hypothetical protein
MKTKYKEYRRKWVMFALYYCEKCGGITERNTYEGSRTKSCGCIRKKYSEAAMGNKLYSKWANMKARCNNKKIHEYNRYGGRGISICDEWYDFEKFREWALAGGYNKNLTIDRINNNGNYEPSNCRFITIAENNRNKESTKLSHALAEQIKTLYETGNYTYKLLATIYGVSKGSIGNIINNKSWC